MLKDRGAVRDRFVELGAAGGCEPSETVRGPTETDDHPQRMFGRPAADQTHELSDRSGAAEVDRFPGVCEFREVEVRIDEAREDEAAREILGLGARRSGAADLGLGPDRDDPALVDQESVGVPAPREHAGVAPQMGGSHGPRPPREHAA